MFFDFHYNNGNAENIVMCFMQQKNRGIYVSLKCLEIFALASEWNLTNVSEALQNTPSELQIQMS